MRVLITNLNLWPPSGTALYVRELALWLQKLGREPVVFSSPVGGIAKALRKAGITVTDQLGTVTQAPDVIHGHHRAPTLAALTRWPTVPAVFVCHDHLSPNDAAPIHPSLVRYIGVSRLCVNRLAADGAPPERVKLMLNFVDIDRFAVRGALPARPARALVFSNYASEETHLPYVREACRQTGLDLDVVGTGVGHFVVEPELLLPSYDVVFAKAKAALEAMAVGNAVILCDASGVGPMVASSRFEELRPLNFGLEALAEPLDPEPLVREIRRYDAADAARVRDLVRSTADVRNAVEDLVRLYESALQESVGGSVGATASSSKLTTVSNRLLLKLYWSFSPATRQRVKSLPGAQFAWAAAGRGFGRRRIVNRRRGKPS